jgi:hypothetical protein
MKPPRKTLTIAGAAAIAIAFAAGAIHPRGARADGASEARAKSERCATRLAIAFTGRAATPALFASASPEDAVDALLADPLFVERFARFANASNNVDPGATPAEDAAYVLTKYVLENDKPWSDVFAGGYDVTDVVTPDPNGLGYFRSDAWMKRYAGNEAAGYRLSSAYRILQNTTGLDLTAVTNADGVDVTATGRQASACRGCHYDGWFALDKVAKILSRRNGLGDAMTFTPPTEGPQEILGGKTIANDKELVDALVASEPFRFNACRLAFGFLYGRAETTCEGAVFDACIDAFTAKGTMPAALAAIAKDPSFCQ